MISAMHMLSCLLMSAGVMMAMLMPRGWPSAVASAVALAAMFDGIWEFRLLSPVVWLAVIIGAVLVAGLFERVARRHLATPQGVVSLGPMVAASGCGNLLMGALLLHPMGPMLGSTGHHGGAFGPVLLVALAFGHALFYIGLGLRLWVRQAGVAPPAEAIFMGGALLAMSLAVTF